MAILYASGAQGYKHDGHDCVMYAAVFFRVESDTSTSFLLSW